MALQASCIILAICCICVRALNDPYLKAPSDWGQCPLHLGYREMSNEECCSTDTVYDQNGVTYTRSCVFPSQDTCATINQNAPFGCFISDSSPGLVQWGNCDTQPWWTAGHHHVCKKGAPLPPTPSPPPPSAPSPSSTPSPSALPCTPQVVANSTDFRFVLDLSKGRIITTGVETTQAIFDVERLNLCARDNKLSNCPYEVLEARGSYQTIKANGMSSSYKEVAEHVSNQYEAGISAGAGASYGVVDIESKATFTSSEIMRRGKTATESSKRTFTWEEYWRTIMLVKANLASSRGSNAQALLTEDFTKRAMLLTSTSSYAEFKSFFTTFGTHYVSQAGVGAKVTFFSEITSSFASSKTYSEIERCLGATFEATFQTAGQVKGLNNPRGTVATDYTQCQGSQNSATSESFSEAMSVDFKVVGGDYRYFTENCGDASTPPWQKFSSQITLDNSELLITALLPVWRLFPLVINETTVAAVQEQAEKYFYQFLSTEGETIGSEGDGNVIVDSSISRHSWAQILLLMLAALHVL